MSISAEHVKKLRDMTGAGMMDAKEALKECNSDFDKAVVYLREKGLADSKKLSPKKRSELFEEIVAIANIGVGIVSRKDIDRINILQATYISMKKAYDKLQIKPDTVLVDGFTIPSKRIKSEGIIKGDEKIQEISAASIIAKVTRDKLMKLVDPVFPKFEFYKNKGYGTKVHIDNIHKYGICELHRKSFLQKKNQIKLEL